MHVCMYICMYTNKQFTFIHTYNMYMGTYQGQSGDISKLVSEKRKEKNRNCRGNYCEKERQEKKEQKEREGREARVDLDSPAPPTVLVHYSNPPRSFIHRKSYQACVSLCECEGVCVLYLTKQAKQRNT